MASAVIIGSGPAAAGAALALSRRADLQIKVLDMGLQLEPDRRRAVEILSTSGSAEWDDRLVSMITEQQVDFHGPGLPEKRTYGSNFPFRDIGQLQGVTPAGHTNRSVISAAYGGFSNIWGAQVMPFAASVFDTWPVSMAEMEEHYRRILTEIPFAAENDDLAPLFPLIGASTPLPPVSARTNRVLDAYAKHRGAINKLGVTLGKARLAFEAGECIRCGLCLTGCPYSLIYSASQTFDKLRASNRVAYFGGLLVLNLKEEGSHAIVTARELATGRMQQFEADRVYVACGAIGTTRLVLNSLRLFDCRLAMRESQQFFVPMVSLRRTPDPRQEAQFTLNQFNVTVAFEETGFELSQLHCYTYNPAFVDALPRPLRTGVAEPARRELLRRLSVALGYLPSWRSPELAVWARQPPSEDALPQLHLSRADRPPGQDRMLRSVVARLLRAGRFLDLYPVLPMLRVAAAGKSYHWGGSFPHADDSATLFSSDRIGRVGGWQRIHLVDASVFPNVPATTFTLTAMANSHRIASESLELPP